MKNGMLLLLVVAGAIVMSATLATAQESQVIHFQGVLTGPDGGPLRTDIYNVNFSIWDHATDGFQALWSEQQTVEVTDGLFDVFLGNGNPLSPDVFTPPEGESELRFLEIQVEGDNPMTPRMQIGKTPNSFVSSRVLGDIETDIGLLRIHPPDPTSPPAPAIEMSADGINNNISINWAEPLDMPSPALEMTANNIMSSLTMNWTQPLDMPSPAIEFNANDVMNNITMNWTQPLDMPSPAIEMSTAPTSGATYRMFQPQPEPPGIPLLEMNTHFSGANFAMTAPSYGGLRTDIESPIIEMATGIELGGSIRMFQPQPEPPGSDPIIEMLVGSNGGNFTMYGQQALLQSTPFFEISSYSTGADLKFFESAGGTTVEINSDGDVIAGRGSFGQNNTNNGTAGFVSGGNNAVYGSYSAIPAGYGNTIGTAADYSCLVGVDASLSADSTFMVDMPHIHFGDETDGYEFPTSDGRPNEMLATDGNGQLSWVDVTALSDGNMRQLIEENKELKNLVMQLERRITELERK